MLLETFVVAVVLMAGLVAAYLVGLGACVLLERRAEREPWPELDERRR